MTFQKLTLPLLIVIFLIVIQCSPSSDSIQDVRGSTDDLVLLLPEKGAENIPVNSEFKWKNIAGVSEYELQFSDQKKFSNVIANLSTDTNRVTLNGFPYESKIFWKVRKVSNNKSQESWSQIYDFTTEKRSENSLPLATTLQFPTDNASNQPIETNLQWTFVINTTNYQLQLANDVDFKNIIVEESTKKTELSISDLDLGQTYYWRVLAIVEGEQTSWSDTWSFTTENDSSPPPSSSNDFVQVSNSNFIVDGEVFRFVGSNAYYLPNYEKIDSRLVNNTLDTFEDTGIRVVRMWAFYDGYDCGYSQQDASENVIQTAPGEYSEQALRYLDNVIAKGKERGIRFLLPFINYWDELGGICQYNTWAGASNPSTNMSYFINSNSAQNWFKDYISMLLNRVNTVTGVAYKKEPAIFGWEIMNEGRNTGEDPAMLRDWYREITQYIKSIDSNHLVATGEEGFDEGIPSEYSIGQYSNTYVLRANEGTSFIMNTAIPEIDFASAHWYPSDWGFGYSYNQDLVNAQHAWLNDHKEIAEGFGKPLVLGEYGYAGWGNQTVLNIYNNMWKHAEHINLDGSMLWQLTTDYVKCYEYGGNICWPDGRQDAELYNNFEDHTQNMNKQ